MYRCIVVKWNQVDGLGRRIYNRTNKERNLDLSEDGQSERPPPPPPHFSQLKKGVIKKGSKGKGSLEEQT